MVTIGQPQNQVSDNDIEKALHSVAQLVENYGDKYWPIFERLEQELDNRHSKTKRLTRALEKSMRNMW